MFFKFKTKPFKHAPKFFKLKPKFFKHKSKQPLINALCRVNDATIEAYKYLLDRNYVVSEKDLQLLDGLAETLLRNHSTVERIATKLRQQMQGGL